MPLIVLTVPLIGNISLLIFVYDYCGEKKPGIIVTLSGSSFMLQKKQLNLGMKLAVRSVYAAHIHKQAPHGQNKCV